MQQLICDVDNFITTGCAATPDGLRFVSSVAVSADDRHVYICSALADSGGDPSPQKETLSAFSRAMDGTLTLVDQEIEDSGGVTTLDSCRGVAVSPDGKHVYTAALLDSAVTWFQRTAATGVLSFTAGDAFVSGGMGGDISGADAVAVSPDNANVYVAGRSGDSLAVFERDTTSGDLTHRQTFFDGVGLVDGLDAPEGIAISPDGKHVYVASETDDAVAVFARDTTSAPPDLGKLTFVEAKFDGVGGVNGLDAANRVALDPTGQNVYVASQSGTNVLSDADWLAVFSRNPATGALTFLQSFDETTVPENFDCGGIGPEDSAVAVSPNGLFVAVSAPFRYALATFSRAADGTLTFVESICDDLFVDDDDIGVIFQLATSPDGKNLYAAGGAASTLSTIDYECDSMNVDLMLTNDGVSDVRSETACRSITAGTNYSVLAAGELTLTSPAVTLDNDFSVEGELTVVDAVP